MTQPRLLLAKLLTLILVVSLVSPIFAAPAKKKPPKKPAETPRAATIKLDPSTVSITPDQTGEVNATVLDQNGNEMKDAEVVWQIAEPKKSPLSFSRGLNDSNTLLITGKTGDAAVQQRISTRIRAVSGDAKNDLIVTYESKPKPAATKINLDPSVVDLAWDGEATIKATLTDANDNPVHGTKVTWKFATSESNDFVKKGAEVNDEKTNSITIFGRAVKDKKAPDVVTLVATAGTAVETVTIKYTGPSQNEGVISDYNVLTSGICGDNFGRTLRNDFYCIEVTIDNHSDSDIALGSLSFKTSTGTIPTSHYPVVQGSLARRKITHPRAITLATIDAMGSLLTGFNPFFHNVNHAKNYSQFIDILSNPVAKGVASVWQDPYPIELANFTSSVLKDDKIIKKDDKTFRTIVFVAKRNVYPRTEKASNDPIDVKARLGKLIVQGQDITQGPSRQLNP